jgi:hypothetical protein
MPTSGFVFTGQSGCLLPMLIMLNLFFGKLIFNSTRLWLSVEGVLVLLFVIKILSFTRKIREQLWPDGQGKAFGTQSRRSGNPDRSKVVDVEGEVVQETRKLK